MVSTQNAIELVTNANERDHKFLLMGMGPSLILKSQRSPPVKPYGKQQKCNSESKM